MRWIRLWVDEIVNGTTFTELNAEQRGVWWSLLILSAYSPKPGTICVAVGVPYTKDQLSSITKIPINILTNVIEHLISDGVGKLRINDDGTISICNWLKYQTEYDRQKGYRRGLRGKVTNKSDEQKSSISISTSISSLVKGLSPTTWGDFIAHRKKINAPMTEEAEKRLLKRLARLVDDGGDAEEIVSRSIENGWRGLFPPNDHAKPAGARRRYFTDYHKP